MVIKNVEIDFDFCKWAEDIKKEVSEYQAYYKKKKKGNLAQIGLGLGAGIISLICMSVCCINRAEHDFSYHLFGAFMITAIVLVALYFTSSTQYYERRLLLGIYGTELDELIKYVNEESEGIRSEEAFDFLNLMPGVEDVIHNWEYISLLHTGDVSVYAEPLSGCDVTLYDKATKERIIITVDHIYADNNAPEDGSEEYILLMNDSSSILYEKGIFDNETKVTILNQGV